MKRADEMRVLPDHDSTPPQPAGTKHWSGHFNIPVGQIQRLLRGQPVVDGLRVGDLAPVLGLLAVAEVHDGRELADPELPRLWDRSHMTSTLD